MFFVSFFFQINFIRKVYVRFVKTYVFYLKIFSQSIAVSWRICVKAQHIGLSSAKKIKGFEERVCISGGENEGKISLDCPIGHRLNSS